MATEYKLSYTAAEIDERLGKVVSISDNVEVLQGDVGVLQSDIQNKAGVVTLSKSEYEALNGNLDEKTFYMINDEYEEDGLPLVSESDNGSFLRVINGVWATASIPNAEEATF